MDYPRDAYVNRLIAAIELDQIKVVTGVRRCGKSFLLNKLFRNALITRGVPDDHVIMVDFDGYRNKGLRDPKAFMSLIDSKMYDDGMFFLLLDEVQLLDDFAEVLNELLRMGNANVYVTGSNAHLLSRDVVTEFRGRSWEIPLRPLSFSEFMGCFAGDKRDGYEAYSAFGGLPAVALMKDNAMKAEYLRSVYEETYLRDIVERNHIRNEADFVELVNVLSSGIGCLTNSLKIANTFKSVKQSSLSRETIEAYITYLEDAFLFEKAQRYDLKGRKYIGSDAKYYAIDMGLRNARMNFRQHEETHALENIVYNELRSRGYRVDVGIVPARKKDSAGSMRRISYECDFVCNRGSERCYVQAAFALSTQEKYEQESESLRRIGDSFKKVIVTKEGAPPHYNEEGILMLNAYDFLLDADSLHR